MIFQYYPAVIREVVNLTHKSVATLMANGQN